MVRPVLYMSALSALRYNPAIQAFAARLRAKGKCFKVVITACMHKMLTILNGVVRSNEPWRGQGVLQKA